MKYKFYEVSEPIFALVLADDIDSAILCYQEEVLNGAYACSCEEIEQAEFIRKLGLLSTESMPTIEVGIRYANEIIKETINHIQNNEYDGKVLAVQNSLLAS